MVDAAKLIGAGSALIALAGVGAGIGIVFSARAPLCCYCYVAILIACFAFSIASSKALSPYGIRNCSVWSGKESLVNDGSCRNMLWRARSDMAKLMNLIYTFPVIKNTVFHIFLKEHLDYDFFTARMRILRR